MDASPSIVEKQAALREFVQQYYPDAHRISVSISDTGEGQHLRWHYSEDLIAPQEEEDEKPLIGPSSATSHASFGSVDDDGDSQMGDEEERFRTPQPLGRYDPGSVVLTPHKWNGVQREKRIGGGFNWQHDENGVEQRLTFVPDGHRGPDGATVDRERLGPDTQRVFDTLRAERERYSSPHRDDDERSVVSLASEATIIIDPHEPQEPTLFNGEMPIVRQPTDPSEQNLSGTTANSAAASSGNSRQARRGLSTIQEEGSDDGRLNTRAGQPRLAGFGHVRLFHDQAGNWVRDGSLPPDADYSVDRSLLPPKIDKAAHAAGLRAAHAARTAGLQRTDTEVVVKPRKVRFKFVPYVEIPMRPIRKAAAPASTPLRRSARLELMKKA